MMIEKSFIFSFILVILFVFLSGCINEEYTDKDSEIYFLIYCSSSSKTNISLSLIIVTNDIEVFNKTIISNPGQEIYKEEFSGSDYYIKAFNSTSSCNIIYNPNGQNALSLQISDTRIELQEITD